MTPTKAIAITAEFPGGAVVTRRSAKPLRYASRTLDGKIRFHSAHYAAVRAAGRKGYIIRTDYA